MIEPQFDQKTRSELKDITFTHMAEKPIFPVRAIMACLWVVFIKLQSSFLLAQAPVGMPYQSGFDSGSAGWAITCGSGTCWELGTPTAAGTAGPFSAPNVFGTDLDSGYTASALTRLTSPYFLNSSDLVPYLSFYQYRYMSTGIDGMYLESQINSQPWTLINGGPGDTLNWYNSPSVFSSGLPGFTGISGGWIRSGIRLPLLDAGDSLRIRFVFHSNTSFGSAQPGIFIDNFSLTDTTGANIDVGPLYMVQPGASLGASQPFDIKVLVENFSAALVDSIRVGYSVNGGNFVQQTIPFGLAPGALDTFQFGTTILPVGYNVIRLFATAAGDAYPFNDTISSGISVANSQPLPYFNDFESDTSGWRDQTLGATRWEYGLPVYGQTTGAYSGNFCWDTDLDSAYTPNAFATLTTPTFDFRNTVAPYLEFALNCKSEDGWDGLRIDYSLNNGATWLVLGSVNDPLATNWYTDPQLNSSSQPAWEGQIPGWILPRYRLSILNGYAAVRFRFLFTSDGTISQDGVSIDNFRIEELPEYDLRLDSTGTNLFTYQIGTQTDSIALKISNLGGLPASGFTCSYAINGSVASSVLINQSIAPGGSLLVKLPGFTVSQGVLTVCSNIDWNLDQNPADNSGCFSVAGVGSAPVPSTFDFDAGGSGWVERSFGPGGRYTRWEHGTPQYGQTSTAYSPPFCWDINLDSVYAPAAVCELYSPMYDLSTAIHPELTFMQNRNINPANDGLRIDFRKNNDTTWTVLGDYQDPNGTNWYNRFWVGNSGKPGWDGSSLGWIRSSFNLDSAFIGTGTVQFRLVFTSGTFNGIDGVSIDDFSVKTDYMNDATISAVASPSGSYISGISVPLTVRLKNAGVNSISGLNIRYNINGSLGNYSWSGFLPEDSSTLVTLGQGLVVSGSNTLLTWIDWPFDQNNLNDTLQSTFTGIPTLPLPYAEDFENGEGSWLNALNTPGTQWEYGTPSFGPLNTAHSGTYCWDVNLSTPYGNLAQAYLASPGFDLGSASEVLLSCWINYRSEAFADGASWEYTTDGINWQGLGSLNDSLGTNWYNGPLYGGRSGWSGIGNGWTQVSYTYRPAQNAPYLRLRMVFVSDPNVVDAGFSLDDVSLTAVTGIAEVRGKTGTIQINPNPCRDRFSAGIPEPIKSLSITDASGRIVSIRILNGHSGKYSESVSGWAPGSYSMVMEGKSGIRYLGKLMVLPEN
jgi:hypothetical protein